jgi:hypothetical protein
MNFPPGYHPGYRHALPAPAYIGTIKIARTKSSKEYRKNWARLIQKIYEVDPLTCPKARPEPVEGCRGIMRFISFIEDREVIQAILKHLGLWLVKSKPVPYLIREPTPKAHAPPALNQNGSGPVGYVLDHFSQLPMNDDHLYRDPDYPWDAYLQSKTSLKPRFYLA